MRGNCRILSEKENINEQKMRRSCRFGCRGCFERLHKYRKKLRKSDAVIGEYERFDKFDPKLREQQ